MKSIPGISALKTGPAATMLLVAISGASWAAPFAFHRPVHVGLDANGGFASSISDFNGDGRDDLAVIGGDGRVHVMLQDGKGALSSRLVLEAPATYFLSLVAGDEQSDGSRELFVGHERGLVAYRWNGSGGFVRTDHPGQYRCGSIATADLDADGATDVFCHGLFGEATLYYSGGTGGFLPPAYMLTAIHSYHPEGTSMQFQLADVTGDGKPDLLAAARSTSSFYVHPHDGISGFLPAIAYPYPEDDGPWSAVIAAADLDGDGSNEVVVTRPGNRPRGTVMVYERGGNGYLRLARSMPSHDIPDGLHLEDVDGDGRRDLLVVHPGWHTVGWYLGRTGGFSGEVLAQVPARTGGQSSALGDLDGDGHVDFAIANSFGVSVLYGGRRAVNDFDGDLVSDALWHFASGGNAIWRSANKAAPLAIDPQHPDWSVQAVGDFNGDGLSDVFWRNRVTGANEVWEPRFVHRWAVTGVTNRQWQVAGSGDFDGDGHGDLLWRNQATGANTIWKRADRDTQQTMRAVTTGWKVAAVGDFDGDARSDILWRHSTQGRNTIWLSGRSETQQAVASVTNMQWKVAGVGDFDGDGKDDIAWRNPWTGVNTIWLAANKAAQQPVTGVTNPGWDIAAVADYDGDGRSDLFWRNSRTGGNVVWRSADKGRPLSVATYDARAALVR